MNNLESKNPIFGDMGYIVPARILRAFPADRLSNLESRMRKIADSAVGANMSIHSARTNLTFSGKIVEVEIQDIRICRRSLLGRFNVTLESPSSAKRKSFCVSKLPQN